MQYKFVTASLMGTFNWKLEFDWSPISDEVEAGREHNWAPYSSPTMAGGLFSINREYFWSSGSYDEKMDIWGGENLEMSFRIWMCGGTLLIATCSRVGHVFRKTTPYTFPGGTSQIVNHNNARLAEVWMDGWKDFYFSLNPLARKVDRGDITARQELRKQLQCKSFRWYLETIYPESQLPLNYHHLGSISAGGRCLDTMGRKAGSRVGLSACHRLGGNQVFAITQSRQIRSDDNCLDAAGLGSEVKIVKCHGRRGNQAWSHNKTTGEVRHQTTGQCLALHQSGEFLQLEDCGQPGHLSQVWSLDRPDWSDQL